MKIAIGYLAAVLVTYLSGTLFISQGNIAAVSAMGFELTFSHRLDAMIHDVTHMYDIYLPLVAVGMLIALPVAAIIIRFLPDLRLSGYMLAGFVALIALHVIMKAVLSVTGIAPTRELTGLIAQGLAGGFGGLAYHWITFRKTN